MAASPFRGYRFAVGVVAPAVRRYLYDRLPYADVAEPLAERGVHVDPSTVLDPVQHATGTRRVRAGTGWARRGPSSRRMSTSLVPPATASGRSTSWAWCSASTSPGPETPRRRSPGRPWPPCRRGVARRAGKAAQQAIERDHQHLRGRYRSMRGFETLRRASTVCAGNGLVRNLRGGFYGLRLVMATRASHGVRSRRCAASPAAGPRNPKAPPQPHPPRSSGPPAVEQREPPQHTGTEPATPRSG